jgi:hypothetical protein
MRGRKSYNIRNIEAHLTSLQNTFKQPIYQTPTRNMVFQPSEQQRQCEYINAKYGVSRYTSNLVSGKMFKKI